MTPVFRSAPLWLALTLALPAWAGPPEAALRAADPGTPAALPRPTLPAPQRSAVPTQPDDIGAARALWREANQRVAEFPRGHSDLLRWEAAQGQPTPTATTPAAPLSLGEALRASLRQQPALFTHADMNPLARARVRVAYADHVRELQHAWVAAIGSRERAQLRRAALDSGRLGSELGQRMVRAGNWPTARLLQEQALEAAAWQASVDAEAEARDALERLAGLMGLWQADAVASLGERLPQGLPALPDTVSPGVPDIEAAALRADPLLDLAREPARRSFAALSSSRWAAWDAAREAALTRLPDPAGEATPPHIDDLSLLRDARLREADEQAARLTALAAERRAMARGAWAQVQARHALAQHAERVVVQLQGAQQQESLLRYNGMFDSTWQLLAATREHLDALERAVAARQAYWRAQASWQAVLAGGR